MPVKSRSAAAWLTALCLSALLGALSVTAFRAVAGQVPSPLTALTADFRRPGDIDETQADASRDAVWALGRKMFFDRRLSASSTLSCASCHQPDRAWTDPLPQAIGEAHRPLAFRAPTLLNAGHIERYGWTGRFPDVETTALFAMGSPANMNAPLPNVIAKLEGDHDYVAAFHAAFPGSGIDKRTIGTALHRFVTSIVSDVAPFDRWVAGDRTAIGADAIRGFAIFTGKGRCAECHSGWAFTDGSFHDIGTATGPNVGRGALFKTSVKLKYAFKTPTLRDVARRSPYMHDGSIATLEAVVDHYDKGGIDRPSRAIGPLGLSSREKADLVAFLKTLSGGSKFALKAECGRGRSASDQQCETD